MAADLCGAHQRFKFLDMVWQVVAADAHRRRTGDAGGMGSGYSARNACTPWNGICRGFDLLAMLDSRVGMDPRNWGNWRGDWGDHDDFFNVFGLPQHDLDQQPQSVQIPENATVQIENPRGDVSITSGDSANIEVQGHQVAFAGSDEEAKKIFNAEQARVTVSGSAVLVKSVGTTTAG